MTGLGTAATAVCALGCAVAGGVFLSFSTIVMPALARLAPADGLGAMQAMNVTAVRPLFMTVLFGTGAVCVVAVVSAVRHAEPRTVALVVAGAALYLVGAIGLTAVFHVPRNDALAALDPTAPASVEQWTRYLRAWTLGNHVRAATAVLAAGSFVVALLVSRT